MARLPGAALLLVAMIACGDDGDSSESPFPPDIRNDDTLGEIGLQDFDRLCRDYSAWIEERYSESIDRSACSAYALRVSATREECDTNYQMCMDDTANFLGGLPAQILGQVGCSGVLNYMDCTTVLQFKTCLTALTVELDEPRFDLSCDFFGNAIASDWWIIEPPESCSSVELDCQHVDGAL